MFEPIKISPSILSADFLHLDAELQNIQAAGADWVHFDVMDGHFVPNITVGIPVLKQLRQATSLPLDVHLMVSNPLQQLPWFLACKPDYVTVHYEALAEGNEEDEAEEISNNIRTEGACAGIALRPDTPVGVLEPIIGLWDMFLIMSVYPGFSGQSYIPESSERVRQLVELCKKHQVSPLIQVDGGINAQTAPLVASFGADVLVAGNAVFKAASYQEAISSIRSCRPN